MYEYFEQLVLNFDINMIKKYINGRKIVLWGGGEGGVIVAQRLISYNIDVYGVIDKNPKNINESFKEKYLLSKEELKGKEKEYYVMVCASYHKEIQEYLDKNDYNPIVDYLYFAKPIDKIIVNIENYNDELGNKIVIEDGVKFIGENLVFFRGYNNILYISKEDIIENCKFVFNRNNSSCIIGKKSEVRGDISIGTNAQVKIGEHVTIGSNFNVLCGSGANIVIGKDCMFSDNITIQNTDAHAIIDVNTGKVININKNIEIFDHVWLGFGCTILGGSVIGESSIVGFNSVVKKVIPNNCSVVGSPCKIVRRNITWDRFNMLECEINNVNLFEKGEYWNNTLE